MPDSPTQRAIGRINVTSYDAKPCDTSGSFTIAVAEITEEFSGALVGVGAANLILATEPGGGTVHFSGMERFLGTVADRSGSFILQNFGTMKDGVLHSVWKIIPGSGTEALEGLCGKGGCDPNGYTLDYWFE
jgi:hypothetical protein